MALIGRHATQTVDMGGGSAQVRPPHQVSIAEGLSARLDGVVVVDGVEVRSRPVAAGLDAVCDPHDGRAGIHFTATDSDGAVVADRHVDDTTVSFGFDDGLPELPAVIRLEAMVGGSRSSVDRGRGRRFVDAADRRCQS